MVFQFQLGQNIIDFQKDLNTFLLDLSSKKDAEVTAALAKQGYLTLPSYENSKYTDYLSLSIAIEEISKYFPKVANSIVEIIFAEEIVKRFAKPECQSTCMKKLQAGELKINVLFSEPGNYELNKFHTEINAVESGYTVKGTKIYAPENFNCNKYLVIGKLLKEGKHQVAIAAVDSDKINIQTKEFTYGSSTIKTQIAEIDTIINEDKLLECNEAGLKEALAIWRTLIAASSLGLAHTNTVSALTVIKNVKNSDNQSLSNSQGVQFTLADIFAEIQGARMVIYYSSTLIDNETPSTKISFIAKVQATEAAVFANNNSASLIGNLGNIYDTGYLETLQLAYNRQIKDGGTRNCYNNIYEEALARR